MAGCMVVGISWLTVLWVNISVFENVVAGGNVMGGTVYTCDEIG